MKIQLSTIIAISLCLIIIIPVIIYTRKDETVLTSDERIMESEEFNSLRYQGKNYFELAMKDYENGDQNSALTKYRQAIQVLTNALQMRPDNSEILNDLGAVYYNLGNAVSEPIWAEDMRRSSATEVMDMLRQAIQEVQSGIIVLSVAQRQLAEQISRHARSQNCYTHIFEIDGSEFDVYVIKGETKDAFIKAEGYLRNAIEANPRYTAAYRNLGALYIKMGRKSEARDMLKIALKLEPYDKELEAYLQQLKLK